MPVSNDCNGSCWSHSMRIVLFLFSKGGHPIDELAWGWFQHHPPTGERLDIALRMHFGEISGVPPTMPLPSYHTWSG